MNSLVAAAAVGWDVYKSLQIKSKASIFTAELVALNFALDIIRRSKRKKFAIFPRSLSSLLAFIIAILRWDMCRNSSLITASWLILAKPSYYAGFQAV